MNGGIIAIIRPYLKEGLCYHHKCNDHYGIYEKMMEITDKDHEISCDAASWCELATVGEIYEFREGQIEIVDMDSEE